MALRFDAALKEIAAQHPPDFAPPFGLPTNEPVKALNVDLSSVSAATDVAFGYGSPLREIADLNFQSGADQWLDLRLLKYNALLQLQYHVPVRSVAVLLRPAADHPRITGKFHSVSGATRIEFAYEAIRLWQQPVERYLTGGIGLLPLAPLCQMPAEVSAEIAIRSVVQEIDRRLRSEVPNAEAARLMTAAFILTGMRVEKSQLVSIFDGVRVMHESTAYDVMLDEGRVDGQQRILLRLGRKYIGPPTPESESALKGIKDLDRLERMADAIFTAKSWEQLLATP